MTTNVKLTSSDGQHFEVEEQYASESQMIKNMVEGEISSSKELAVVFASRTRSSEVLFTA